MQSIASICSTFEFVVEPWSPELLIESYFHKLAKTWHFALVSHFQLCLWPSALNRGFCFSAAGRKRAVSLCGQFSFEVICEVGLNTEASAGHQTFEKHHTHCPEAEQLNVFEVQWSFLLRCAWPVVLLPVGKCSLENVSLPLNVLAVSQEQAGVKVRIETKNCHRELCLCFSSL